MEFFNEDKVKEIDASWVHPGPCGKCVLDTFKCIVPYTNTLGSITELHILKVEKLNLREIGYFT